MLLFHTCGRFVSNTSKRSRVEGNVWATFKFAKLMHPWQIFLPVSHYGWAGSESDWTVLSTYENWMIIWLNTIKASSVVAEMNRNNISNEKIGHKCTLNPIPSSSGLCPIETHHKEIHRQQQLLLYWILWFCFRSAQLT